MLKQQHNYNMLSITRSWLRSLITRLCSKDCLHTCSNDLRGSWKSWLLLSLQLLDSLLDVSVGILSPECLVFMTKLPPIVPMFVDPICNPLPTRALILQGVNLFAQPNFSLIVLRNFVRYLGFCAVVKGFLRLRKAS